MTQTADTDTGTTPVEMVNLTIDGVEISVPKGTLVIRAAELIGIQIPRFCDHPLLDPVGACRQCLVEVEGQRKPMASCTTTCTPDMEVRTQLTSEAADKAQQGVMELLLINHPLDCPVCDKGGECPLQNQAMSNGRAETRFEDVKRTFPKPINISSEVLLDRERCVLCARCTRFSEQIAGDPFIDLLERGALQQVGIAPGEPFASYYSGNTVQICPVGALTGAAYRFRARPFDLVSSPSVCEHCASGCAQRTDHRRGKVMRRLAGDDPQVNEEWNCDKGRWAFTYTTQGDRITTPQIRDEDGKLRPASWSEALGVAGAGLAAARGSAGVLVGGRVTVEDAYAYSKFARMVLDTNDIDFRARPHSAEEAEFLAAHVAGRPMEVTYADLDKAPAVLLAGFEPEEESPIVFLRLRKSVRKNALQVTSIAPFATRALVKLRGRLIATSPGGEAAALDGLADDAKLNMPGAVILVGERLATSPGALSAASRLAAATGARLAWIPRRAGERGALEAGALPGLLPGGRPLSDQSAREQTAAAWNVGELPTAPGRDTAGILDAARSGELSALLVGGVELADLADPAAALAAIESTPFVVSLELRESAVTELADVIFPIAPVVEKAGSFMNWEGRIRPFEPSLLTNATPDMRVLTFLADEVGVALNMPTALAAGEEMAGLGLWVGQRPDAPQVTASRPARPRGGAGRPGRLAHAARCRTPTGRRTASRGHRSPSGRADVEDHRHRDRRCRRRSGFGAHRARRDHASAGDHRYGRPHSVAAAELARIRGTSAAWRDIGSGRIDRAGRAMTYPDPTLFGHDPWWLVLAKALFIFVFLMLSLLVAILIERKILGWMQMRPGPNRVGPWGLLQSLVDGVKLALKEGLIPAGVDKFIYLAAPVISVVPAFIAFSVIPMGGEVSVFGHRTALQLTDFPVAVLFILAATSIGVYGIVLAGWASGSTYPLLGGLRSSAQVISYEIAMALSFAAVFIYAGTMSTSGIVAAQQGTWYVFLLLPSFVVYVTSMVGETNRAPFDLPEAEGELVGGFHTEYSSIKFAMFMLAEYVNMFTVSALATTLFFGGWHAPWPINMWDGANTGWWPLLWFTAKLWGFMFMFFWLRGTLPRMRYDQFMALGWKVLIPVSLVWIMIVASTRSLQNQGYTRLATGLITVGAVVALFLLFALWRTVRARKIRNVPPQTVESGAFPVPPLPTVTKGTASKETSNA